MTNKILILVIDDDVLVLKTFTKLLKSQGYEVIPTASYEEAVEAFKNSDFNLILSDIRMPGKNGVEVIKEIRRILNITKPGKDIPIIFITGYAEISDELKAEILGEVLLKPVDLERLLITIREYL